MNPWPQECSVLIMDNCSIHKSEELAQAVYNAGKNLYFLFFFIYIDIYIGCRLVFLPAYSPDFNPIEESFSSGMFLYFIFFILLTLNS